MRKFYFILLFCMLASSMAAQLKVANNGNVGIQLDNNTPISTLGIGTVGDSYTKVDILANKYGLRIACVGSIEENWKYAVIGKSELTTHKFHVGLSGCSFDTIPWGNGRTWGVLGIAGNSTSGYNYGVFGTTYGSQYGAGVVGTVNNNLDVNIYDGIYAGYFVGNVKVTGTINGVLLNNSDQRYKRNVISLANASSNALSSIMQMNPVEYNLEQIFIESAGDSAVVKQGLYDENSQLFQKKHYGLIAQELQELYPDLVYENDNGYLSINYTELIPVLIQSIKELKGEIDMLKPAAYVRQAAPAVGNNLPYISSSLPLPAALYQNSPNPFSQTTVIKYYLPEEVNTALLCIYDMNGRQIKQMALSGRGEGSETIHGSELAPGIYLYALIADGKEVDVKRMILTE